MSNTKNEVTSKINSSKMIRIRSTDASGDTALEQVIGDAVQTIINAHTKNKKWAFIGSEAFTFSAKNANDNQALLNDAARLFEVLNNSPEGVTVLLTGDLVGGTTDLNTVLQNFKRDIAEAVSEVVDDYSSGGGQDEPAVFVIPQSAMDSPADFVDSVQQLRDFAEENQGQRVVVTVEGSKTAAQAEDDDDGCGGCNE